MAEAPDTRGPIYESLFVFHALIALLWFVDLPFMAPYWFAAMIVLHAILPAWTYIVSRRGSRWTGLLLGHGGLILAYAGFVVWFAIQHWSYPWAYLMVAIAAAILVGYSIYCMIVVAILRRILPPPGRD